MWVVTVTQYYTFMDLSSKCIMLVTPLMFVYSAAEVFPGLSAIHDCTFFSN